MIDISVCIVTLNAGSYLRDCLKSLSQNTAVSHEVIVVNNGSRDDTLAMLADEFPTVQVISTEGNEGFTRPVNRALRVAQGRYLLLLNPDTIVHPTAIDRLVAYLEHHPQVGIVGPKVLNRNGSLQLPCRRGVPRPWAMLSYFLGLARLFPHSKFFSGYLLTYLPENETVEVDGVSGSCMCFRRAVYEQIGGLDEGYFAYQEDADYCFQAHKAGWKVVYFPEALITHFGGQGGSRAEPTKAVYEWHRSYFRYYRKNLAKDYFFLFNWFYYFLMLGKLGIALLVNLFRREKYVGPRRG